jgi:hypothetical protein
MKFSNEDMKDMQERYMKLQEKDKEALRKFFIDSRESRLLRMVVGPDYMDLVSMFKGPKRGIAAPR